MTLSEELDWRGFIYQTTYKDLAVLDKPVINFYWGVDPSADSMTIGNLATAMLVRHFLNHGHKTYLLVGGATGLIGDPDGKKQERDLITQDELNKNKAAIIEQYKRVFNGLDFEIVDNYDWFKDMNYLSFLRDVGKHVPMRQMLGREFVQTRLGEEGAGISYAEFSYVLIQAYDFLRLFNDHGVTLQVSGADQWGNCIAGVDLIRRVNSKTADVLAAPLIVNQATGQKFGKTEDGAIWLDPNKTTPTAFYQFWINCDDDGISDYLKVYSQLTKAEFDEVMTKQKADPKSRIAQKTLAKQVTEIVHGKEATGLAESVTGYLTGERPLADANEKELTAIRQEIPNVKAAVGDSLVKILVECGLASSNASAKNLILSGAVYLGGQTIKTEALGEDAFSGNRLLLRRGKAFKDSALIERQ